MRKSDYFRTSAIHGRICGELGGRVVSGTFGKKPTPQMAPYKPTIYAGSTKLMYELRYWYEGGDLKLSSAAAPRLVEESTKLDAPMKTPVIFRPNQIKDERKK